MLEEDARHQDGKVLVVDDDAFTLDILSLYMRRAGYACTAERSGRAAIERLHEDDFDVALIDLVMPGVDGLEILSNLTENEIETVPIMVSGQGGLNDAVEAMKLGAFDYIEKPVSEESLQSIVQRAIEHRRLKQHADRMTLLVNQWEATFDAVPELIALIDEKFRIVHANKSFAERLGKPRDALTGQLCYKAVHNRDSPPEWCPHGEVLKTGRMRGPEVFDDFMGGDFLLSFSPVHDRNGQFIGTVHVAQDISEQRRSEKEFRFKNTLLEAQAESSIDGMLVVDPEGKVLLINDRFAQMWGIPSEVIETGDDAALLEQIKSQLAAPDEFIERVKYLYEHRDETSREEIEFKDGRVFDRYSAPLVDRQGDYHGRIWYFRDMTDRKRSEEEVRRAHRETERLLVAISLFFIATDNDLRITRWNAAAETTLGFPAGDVLGKKLTALDLSWDREQVKERLASAAELCKTVQQPDIAYTRPDGHKGLLTITVDPIFDDDSKPVGYFLLGGDVTERRELESQLLQLQKLESIGRLAAGIAHEINSPIQYVGDNVRFLKDAFDDFSKLMRKLQEVVDQAKKGTVGIELFKEIDDTAEEIDLEFLDEEIPRAITESLEGVDRVATIVRAMKEFSHPGTDEKKPIDLNHSIQNTITVARNEWKYVADIETDLDDGLPSVACLPGQVHQVILNLIINAVHAIRDMIDAGKYERGTITVATRSDGDFAEIRLSDTGAGIPEDVREHIFDPFFTTKDVGKGTGQGLSIAHDVIVNKHGGSITVESEVGNGTTFIIRLPVKPPEDEEEEQ